MFMQFLLLMSQEPQITSLVTDSSCLSLCLNRRKCRIFNIEQNLKCSLAQAHLPDVNTFQVTKSELPNYIFIATDPSKYISLPAYLKNLRLKYGSFPMYTLFPKTVYNKILLVHFFHLRKSTRLQTYVYSFASTCRFTQGYAQYWEFLVTVATVQIGFIHVQLPVIHPSPNCEIPCHPTILGGHYVYECMFYRQCSTYDCNGACPSWL